MYIYSEVHSTIKWYLLGSMYVPIFYEDYLCVLLDTLVLSTVLLVWPTSCTPAVGGLFVCE